MQPILEEYWNCLIWMIIVSLSLAKILYIYEPKYGIAEGAIPKYVVFNETTQIGFEDIYVTNNSIYTLLHSIGWKLYLRKLLYLIGREFQ